VRVRGHDGLIQRRRGRIPIGWAGAVTQRSSITSSANDRLKAVRRLARRRHPDVFLVEGHRQLRRAIEGGVHVREVFAAPGLFLGDADPALVETAARHGARVVELGDGAFRSISGRARPDGLIAVAERPTTALSSIDPGPWALLLVAEGIERPGNLGTIARSACSSGASGLLVCDSGTDVYHPDAVRGSVGTLFLLGVARCTSASALAWLREHEIAVVVATPDGGGSPWTADLRRPVALVVGNERHGLSNLWRAAADDTISIPMLGPADSLNVAVAAGIVLFEAVRQRTCG
jgi:TrmH family RNA methyltransferase